MRVRKKKHGSERFDALVALSIPFDKQQLVPKAPSEYFGDYNEYRLEIGCGKGDFINGMALRYPSVGFVGAELIKDVVITAMEKTDSLGYENIRYLCADAKYLGGIFRENSFSHIYINFCDPWPKARHAKRRLTSRGFLSLFIPLLTKDGIIEFKTDNLELFEYSVEEFKAAGFVLSDVTNDLHINGNPEFNVMTEYERNFSQKG